MAMVEEFADVNDCARRLAAKFLPGALTLVMKKKPHVTTGIARGIETIGVRIPDHEFCLDLARTFGKPYTATSANKSGSPVLTAIPDILSQLGSTAELIDLAVDAAVFPMRQPTTVVNVVSGSPVILREGAIPKADILNA